jgi:NADH-quinone oxidoreductase subunit E
LSAIQTVLEKHPNAKRESLIAILQEVQDVEGYLSHEAICRIGEHLKLPSAKVYGVATFYNQFRFVKPGVFKIQLCRGTACHVKGSLKVLEAVKNELKIEPGQTTKTDCSAWKS